MYILMQISVYVKSQLNYEILDPDDWNIQKYWINIVKMSLLITGGAYLSAEEWMFVK